MSETLVILSNEVVPTFLICAVDGEITTPNKSPLGLLAIYEFIWGLPKTVLKSCNESHTKSFGDIYSNLQEPSAVLLACKVITCLYSFDCVLSDNAYLVNVALLVVEL